MAYHQVDPGSLAGDALISWYRRTPQKIADERRGAAADAYNRFFYPTRSDQSLASDVAGLDDQESPGDDVNGPSPVNNGQANASPGFGAALSVAPTIGGPSPFAPAFGAGLLGDWTRDNSDDWRNQDGTAASTPGSNDQDDSQLDAGSDYGDDAPNHSTVDTPVQVAAAGRGFLDYWSVPGCANCHGYTPDTLPPYGGRLPFPPNVTPRSGNSGGGRSGPADGGDSGRNPPQCVVQYENDSEICRSLPAWDARKRCWASAAEREGYCNKTKGEVGYPSLITR